MTSNTEAPPDEFVGGCQRGVLQRVVLDLAENRSFSGSGRPRGASKPSKKVGATFWDGLKALRGRPDPENDRCSAESQTPLC